MKSEKKKKKHKKENHKTLVPDPITEILQSNKIRIQCNISNGVDTYIF
ncbi:hypothetical protein SAMN02910384_03331 [Pseudobutyrivibrio sp. ACV-2]|nr:hypothetical protein [Pseudobutyrivibrio sp. ACV-2]SEB07503.1 hypothetical protein SAMN02910384_03331 [Pseudobutyrivibrio sp. ACV-2]